MHVFALRSSSFLLAITAAVWAGCSSGDDAVDPTPVADAGGGAITDTSPDTASPIDAGDAAPPLTGCALDRQSDGLHGHLSCTGLYSDFAAKTVAADAKPYTPGVTFWSDGAEKSRFLQLPAGGTIDITDFDDWKFPIGTKVWKEFRLSGKRIETRFYTKKDKNNWLRTTYRWDDTETDAVRLDTGALVASADGGAPYEIPSANKCDTCHSGRTDQLLGVEAVGLGIATAQGITLATLAADARFSKAPPLTTVVIPDGYNGTAAPALGWMHANCGACHVAMGSSGTELYLRLRVAQLAPTGGAVATVESLDSYTSAVNVRSMRADVDAGGGALYKELVPGSPSSSLLSILSGRRVPSGTEPNPMFQMPPLVTRSVDSDGHALLDAWITQLP